MNLKHVMAIAYDNIVQKGRKILSPYRQKKIKNTSFTIISNNCWAGKIYQRYGLPYETPTVGLYFFASDYIKFVYNLRYYISLPIKIIDVHESKYYEIIKERNQLNCPIGKLDDIEIVFQHYKTAEDAKIKWERRKKRINWSNLIIKFSNMNYCTDVELKQFNKIPYEVKFSFVNTRERCKFGKEYIYVDGYEEKDGVMDDTTHYDKYININKLINYHDIICEATPALD